MCQQYHPQANFRLADPSKIAYLSQGAIPVPMGDLERRKATLWARIMFSQGHNKKEVGPDGDRLLSVKDAVAGASGLEKLFLPIQSEATT